MKYFTPYELVRRLEVIPTVKIHSFEEPIQENGKYTAEILLHFPDEYDETAYSQVTTVIDSAANWTVIEVENPSEDLTHICFELNANAPTALQDKFNLI